MDALDWVVSGGLIAGALAGGAARFGHLCTMSAIEDALVGQDYRGLKAWGLAIAVAIITTQMAAAAGLVDLSQSIYASSRLQVVGAALGGTIFGLGMTLVGTCGFGLLVRAGSGDLRAAVSAMILGVVAMGATVGLLEPVRLWLAGHGALDLAAHGGASVTAVLARGVGSNLAPLLLASVLVALVAAALLDRRLRQRPRLLLGAGGMGAAITIGWIFTTRAVEALATARPESLSFVAPVGRALLQVMTEPFRDIGFGVAAMIGVVAASLVVALARREFRWEAFDDSNEMRRHMLGAALMGFGGVLGQGCTIGQGLSAASALAMSAPIFLAGVMIGAKIGLLHLLSGRPLWRLGRP